MIIVLMILMLFVACAALYHAGERRTSFGFLKQSEVLRLGLRIIATLLLAGSLWISSLPRGWELGVPIWLGVLILAGGTSLVLAALNPRVHRIFFITAVLGCVGVGVTAISGQGWL